VCSEKTFEGGAVAKRLHSARGRGGECARQVAETQASIQRPSLYESMQEACVEAVAGPNGVDGCHRKRFRLTAPPRLDRECSPRSALYHQQWNQFREPSNSAFGIGLAHHLADLALVWHEHVRIPEALEKRIVP
jgi:hypothetical protein